MILFLYHYQLQYEYMKNNYSQIEKNLNFIHLLEKDLHYLLNYEYYFDYYCCHYINLYQCLKFVQNLFISKTLHVAHYFYT